jgi:acyl-CoA thioesterase FadM
MNLLIRLLRVIIHALFRPPITFFQESVVHFRVLPNDLDWNMHMTNSRYLSIMDLGRVDFLVRTGLGKLLLKNKRQAVLGAANIRFRRALKPLQEYSIHTRIIGVDEKWSYIEHRFESKCELIAYAIVKGIFINRQGSVPIPQILQELGQPTKLPELSETLQLWSKMDDTIKQNFGPKRDKPKRASAPKD